MTQYEILENGRVVAPETKTNGGKDLSQAFRNRI